MQDVFKPGSDKPFGQADAAQIAKAGKRFSTKPVKGKAAAKDAGDGGNGGKAADNANGDGNKGGADPSAVKKS